MKLRLTPDSIRLRLSQSEVRTFVEIGNLEESLFIGPADEQRLTYRLESDDRINDVSVTFESTRLTVWVPALLANRWTSTDMVGIEGSQQTAALRNLNVLVEKDVGCLKPRPGDDDLDAFSNPQAEKVC